MLLDFFEHFENRLGSVDKQAFVRLAEATTFQSIATGTTAFCHDSPFKNVISPLLYLRCPVGTGAGLICEEPETKILQT